MNMRKRGVEVPMKDNDTVSREPRKKDRNSNKGKKEKKGGER